MASKLYREMIEINKSVRLWGKAPWFVFKDGLVMCPKTCGSHTFGFIKLVKSVDEFNEFIGDDIMAISPDLLGKINTNNKKLSDIGDFKRFENNKRLAVEVKDKIEYIGVIDKPIESLLETRKEIIDKMNYFKENLSSKYKLTDEELDELFNKGEEMNIQVGDNTVILNKVLLPGINKKSKVIIETVDSHDQLFEVKVIVTRDHIDTIFFFKALKL
jgi:hypothetical protein